MSKSLIGPARSHHMQLPGSHRPGHVRRILRIGAIGILFGVLCVLLAGITRAWLLLQSIYACYQDQSTQPRFTVNHVRQLAWPSDQEVALKIPSRLDSKVWWQSKLGYTFATVERLLLEGPSSRELTSVGRVLSCVDFLNIDCQKKLSPNYDPEQVDWSGVGRNGIRRLRLAATQISGMQFRKLVSRSSIETLILVSEENLLDLVAAGEPRLDKIEDLVLKDTRVGADGIEALLERLPRLKRVYICRSCLNDRCCTRLFRACPVRDVCIDECPLTDSAFEHVSEAEQLERLDLYGVALGADALERLSHRSSLRYLSLVKCGVDADGHLMLRSKLPNCVVHVSDEM